MTFLFVLFGYQGPAWVVGVAIFCDMTIIVTYLLLHKGCGG
jgi:hypothetical protein